jgi:hypothetical protein
VINYFVLRDQVVMTPLFLGGEPVVTTTGRYAGNAILQVEQNEGLAFMRALDESQQRAATLAREKTRDDLQAGMQQDNLILPYQGVRVDGLSAALKCLASGHGGHFGARTWLTGVGPVVAVGNAFWAFSKERWARSWRPRLRQLPRARVSVMGRLATTADCVRSADAAL